jgi:ribosomal protein L31
MMMMMMMTIDVQQLLKTFLNTGLHPNYTGLKKIVTSSQRIHSVNDI